MIQTKSALESSADAWLNHFKTGERLYAEENYPAAIDAFNKSIALNENWYTYQGLGSAQFAKHKNNQAAIDKINNSIE